MHGSMAEACRRIVESSWFDPLMLAVIFVNAVTLGLETSPSIERSLGDELNVLNGAILGASVVELLIRFGAAGWRPRVFARNRWNLFDFVIIAASFTPGIRE